MLSPEALETWCSGIGVPSHSRALMDQIRTSDPARRVGGGRSNVCGRYPSRKMGVTIQFESHRVELAGIYEMEHDATVLEYFDQPPAIKLNYESASTKLTGLDGLRPALCEYFYRLPRMVDRVDHPTLYEVLRIPASASPSELRVAFKLRDLELQTAGAARSQRVALERA